LSNNTICIQLVDDHAVIREGLRQLLDNEKDICVVAESDSAEQAWKDYLDHKPDIVIMDISMPGIGGIEGIQRILSRDSKARIIALTMLGSGLVTRVMELGAKGYLSKSAASNKLIKAIHTVMQGRTFVDAGENWQNIDLHHQAKGFSNPFDSLTKREFEVVILLLAEKSITEIADIIGMGYKTVHTHKTSILNKLKVTGMVGLARLAMKHSIIKNE